MQYNEIEQYLNKLRPYQKEIKKIKDLKPTKLRTLPLNNQPTKNIATLHGFSLHN